jgi:hypothetical protein
MPLTYPLSLPAVPGFTAMSWRPVGVVGMTQSPYTGQRQTFAWPGQWWEVSVSLPPMASAELAEPWVAFLTGLNNQEGTFLLGDEIHPTPRGVATGTPLVKGASQTGYDLITDGWSNSITGIMKAGDWIQLSSGGTSRLHKLTKDSNSNGSGEATLTLWPALRTSPADNSAVVISYPKGVFALASPPSWGADELREYGIGFAAKEVLT